MRIKSSMFVWEYFWSCNDVAWSY